MECENIVIWLWDDKEKLLKPSWHYGIKDEEIAGHSFKKSEGIIGRVFTTGETIFEKDLKSSKYFVEKGNVVQRIRDILVVPLYKENKIFGVFDITNKKHGVFTDDDLNKITIVASFVSILFYFNNNKSEQVKNYQFYSILLDILSLEHFTESEKSFYTQLRELLENSFKCKVGIEVQRAGFTTYECGIDFIPEKIERVEKMNFFQYKSGYLFYNLISQRSIYVYLDDTEGIDNFLFYPRYKIIFQYILHRIFLEFYYYLEVKTKNNQLDFLQKLMLGSFKNFRDILYPYIEYGIEIYNNYMLYSLEYYELKKDHYELLYSEGPFKNQHIKISVNNPIVETLSQNDIFILNREASNSYENFQFVKDFPDKTVSLYAKAIKINNQIKYIFVFRWDSIFSPALNFFNFVELLEKQIVLKNNLIDDINYIISGRDGIFQLFLKILGLFDAKLFVHLEKVKLIALKLNQLLALSFNTESIILASYFHDIGKIFLDDTNISKHLDKGYEFIKDINIPTEVKEVTLYHDEMWNGKGPKGLKKEEIPALARLIHFANIIDNFLSMNNNNYEMLKKYFKSIANVEVEKELISIIVKNWNVFVVEMKSIYES